MQNVADNLKRPLADLLLSVADDKLMLGHRNSDWTGLGPVLEEDIAFSSLAQDEMAHAQALYELAGEQLGTTADNLAFGRPPEGYRCCVLVEAPDEFDWATAIVRQFFCDHFDQLRLQRLSQSSYKPLADLAKRLAAEEQVHVEHADLWIQRLGNGTDESIQRTQLALDALSALAGSLFESVADEQALVDAGLYPALGRGMFEAWHDAVSGVVGRTKLSMTVEGPTEGTAGGRRGLHSSHLPGILEAMCEVYRIEPGVAW